MIIQAKSPYQPIPLGYAGENISRTVVFDISHWVEQYGEGSVLLLAKRPGDDGPYPAVIYREENQVLWPVREEDLYSGGYGEAQLSYTVGGEVVARSPVYRTTARSSIEDGKPADNPEKSWVAAVTEVVAQVESSASEAAASAGEAKESAEGAAASAESAQESAQSAGQAAQNAAEISQRVQTLVTSTSDAASSAAEASEQAANSASEAAKAAENAAASASVAATSATNAGTSAEQAAQSARRAEAAAGKIAAPAILSTVRGELVNLPDSAESPLQGLVLYGKSVQESQPSLENPAEIKSTGNGGSIQITILGANILPPARDSVVNVFIPSGTTLYLKTKDGAPSNGGNILLKATSDEDIWFSIEGGEASSTTTLKKDVVRFYNYLQTGAEFSLQFTDAPFIAYVHPQTLTLETPDGLSGIPVESGGNYTDGNGQQWVCDTVYFASGMVTRRCGRIDRYNGEEVGNVWISSTGQLSTGASVLYQLDTPVTEEIPSDTLDAYAALTAYKPVTNIMSDNEPAAEISAHYIADTKAYIDRQFEALANLQKQMDALIGAESEA